MWREGRERWVGAHTGNGGCNEERGCTWGKMRGDVVKKVGCECSKTAKESACDDAGSLDGAELLRCCAPEQNNADGTVK